MIISLKNVVEIVDCGDGRIQIAIPCDELDASDAATLARLFPHCDTRIAQLLATEHLLASIDHAPPTDNNENTIVYPAYRSKRT